MSNVETKTTPESKTVANHTHEIVVVSSPSDSVKVKKGRARKYATPEEAHQVKLRQMKEWRERKKAEKASLKELAFQAEAKTESKEVSKDTEGALRDTSEEASDDNTNNDTTEFKLVLKFASAEERDQYVKKVQQK